MGQRLWRRLVEPASIVAEIGDRRRAELLAGLLVVIVPLGWISGVAQLRLVPGFRPTFVAMAVALTVLSAAYATSRTRHFRVGGALASFAPVVACAMVVVRNPDDRVWYGFMCLGTVLAIAFLSVRGAAVVAALTVATTVVLLALVPALRDPSRAVPALALQLILLPAVLVVARYRDRLEDDRRAALAASEQTRRLEALGRLAGGVAHDFNNLLTVIVLNAQYVLTRERDPKRVEEILSAAQRATDLVRQLLTFARKEVRPPGILDLSAVIAGLQPLLGRLVASNVKVEIGLAEKLPTIQADRAQVEQIVMNLVLNANDAMPDGGTVSISVREAGGMVELRISDDGHGMPPEVADRAFEPFFTTKDPAKGTGLGLATVHGIVQQTGGTITLDTAVGRGTTVLVELPANAETPTKPETAETVEDGDGAASRETVLVVDDEPAVRDVLSRILSRAGFHVLVASDGEQAMRAVADHGPIDVLVTDVMMPGMGGVELAKSLRSQALKLRVLFVTAHGGVLLDGATCLQKPFAPDDLVRSVRALPRE